jgi:tetratricopeptide (TPR) repeat protein
MKSPTPIPRPSQRRVQGHAQPSASIEQRFASLDYAGVALQGADDLWQTHAARALLRNWPEDRERLAQFDQTDARLHLGAAHWIRGDDDQAASILRKQSCEHARRLLDLIERPKIQVLAQLPWTRLAPHDLLSGVSRDPKFEVRNISYHPDDVQNRPYADVRQFLDPSFDPAFYLCTMVEWHQIPANLDELRCPKLGQTADYDLHAQVIRPWYDVFDELFTTDPGEWADVAGLVDRPVCSFPKVFGLPESLPPIPNGPRGLDFFISGTLLDHMHPDKVARVHEVLGMDDIEARVLRGFVRSDAYFGLLADSKVSFSYIRRPGATSTRGLETLAMGCALALQEESVLRLWLGESEGVATYSGQSGELPRCIERILRDWPRFSEAAQRGARRVREEFSLPRVGSEYLRFATFRAAAERPCPRVGERPPLLQKRSCMRVGWMPQDLTVRRRTMHDTVRRMSAQLASAPDEICLGDMVRELLLEFAFYEQDRDVELREPGLFDQAISLLRRGIAAFPASLALRFQLLRAGVHFGDTALRAEALAQVDEILGRPEGDWLLPAMADVMPIDYFGEHFHYRAYLDALHDSFVSGEQGPTERVRLVLASVAAYGGRELGQAELFELAAELDPGFAPYRFSLARSLHESGDAASCDRAIRILRELVDASTVFVEAHEMLERLLADRPHAEPIPKSARLPMQRVQEASIEIRRFVRAVQPAKPDPNERQKVRAKLEALGDKCALSVLVPWPGTANELSDLLADLCCQTIVRELQVVIAVSPEDASKTSLGEQFEAALHLQWCPVSESSSHAARLNRCIEEAEGELLTVAGPGDRFDSSAFERLAGQLLLRAELSVVYPDQAASTTPAHRFSASCCEQYKCGAAFSRRRLFSHCPVGPHAMWRRRLHDRYGLFDESYLAATEQEFWLRLGPRESFFRYQGTLSLICSGDEHLALRLASFAPEQLDRARLAHWPPSWGPLPERVAEQWLASTLYPSSIRLEAEALKTLGAMSPVASEEAIGLLDFYEHCLLQQDLHCAEIALKTCLDRHPQGMTARLAYAELQRLSNGPAAAGQVLGEALRRHSLESVLRKRLAVCQHECGDLEGARASLLQARAAAPRDAAVLLSLAAISYRGERFEEAEEQFRAALELSPHDPHAIAGLAASSQRLQSAAHSPASAGPVG